MKSPINESQMREVLQEFVNGCGTQAEAAESLGFSTIFLGDMLRGQRTITKRLARKLGYERGYWYQYTGDTEE